MHISIHIYVCMYIYIYICRFLHVHRYRYIDLSMDVYAHVHAPRWELYELRALCPRTHSPDYSIEFLRRQTAKARWTRAGAGDSRDPEKVVKLLHRVFGNAYIHSDVHTDARANASTCDVRRGSRYAYVYIYIYTYYLCITRLMDRAHVHAHVHKREYTYICIHIHIYIYRT